MKKKCINVYGPIVIAGFPGVGKSTFKKNIDEKFKGESIKVYDSDSSKYKENWPDDYISHIINLIEKNKYAEHLSFIMVSTHKEVLEKLVEAGVRFTIVVPKREDKETFITRYSNRGSSVDFCNLLSEKWDSFINDIWTFIGNPLVNIVRINSTNYIEDIFNDWVFEVGYDDITLPFGTSILDTVHIFDWLRDYINSEYDFGFTKHDLELILDLIDPCDFDDPVYNLDYIRVLQIIKSM